MDLPTRLASLLLAQAPPAAPTAANTDAAAVPIIALKRWYGSLTLSSPASLPTRVGFLAFLAGLAGLLMLAILAQGPRRALGQFLDLAGLARLVSGGMARLRRSGRMVAVLLGATVVAWTAWQAPLHNRPEKKEELALLLKSKTRLEFAGEQGGLAALTPFRDVLGLGDTLVLLVGAAALVFKFSADHWGRFDDRSPRGRSSLGGRTTLCWAGAGLYAMYRLASLITEAERVEPLGGCLFVEVAAVPALMILADALILAWILVELRGHPGGEAEEGFDVAGTIRMVPAAVLACLVALPARYAATAAGLGFFYHLPARAAGSPWVLTFLRGWGLAWLQAASLPAVGMIGAAAWSRGSWGSLFVTYGRMLRAEGGRLAALVALAGACVGGVSAAAYYGVLALPAQPWVLLAADSYAHYASLPVGLIMLAALVELAGRVAPATEPVAADDEPGIRFDETSDSRLA